MIKILYNFIIATFFLTGFTSILKAQHQHPIFKFGVIADIQYADKKDTKTRFYKSAINRLDSCVDNLNKEKLAFSVVFGDLVDEGSKDLIPVMDRLEKLYSPYKNVLGNHDYVNEANPEQLYKKYNMPASYYTFEKDKWLFIVLNTNEVSAYGASDNSPLREIHKNLVDSLKARGRKNAYEYNGGIGLKQLIWLDKTLTHATKKKLNVIIFSHHPLFPENGFEALNNREILSVVQKYQNVKALIAGHHHVGSFEYYDKIPAITLAGMVEAPTENAYGIISLYPDKMVLNGTGKVVSRTLKF